MSSNPSKSSATVFRVKKEDLPLSCPKNDEEVWSMHPRVFLPIEKTGEATCPYCGAKYVLQD